MKPMTEPAVPWSLEALTENETWLRPLVRSLVDAPTADDVLQETWLRAWQRPPRTAGAMRTWLTRVATNFAHSQRRSERRRQRHEAVDDPGTTEATAVTVERLALHRAISQAVVELPEPYRSVVLLRHYHDCDAAQIAARTGTSEANVRQRLHRGHEWLRQRLAAELGERWPRQRAVRALLGLPFVSTTLPAVAIPALLAMNKIRFAIAGLVVLGLFGAALWSPLSSGGGGGEPLPMAPTREVTGHPGAAAAPAAMPDADASPARAAATPAAPAARGIDGTIIDNLGRPVRDVRIALTTTTPAVDGEAGQPLATSDAFGRFHVAGEWRNHLVVAQAPWVALAVAPPHDAPGESPAMREALVVVAPGRAQSLRVVDPEGRAIGGVTASVANFALVDFPQPLEHATQTRWPERITDADGRCAWPRLPTVATFLALQRVGFAPARLVLDETIAADHTVTLQPLGAGARLVTGVVTDNRGAWVAAARVGLGSRLTTTDRHGAFVLRIHAGDELREDEVLHAVAPGWYPAHEPRFGARLTAAAGGTLAQDLQLTQPVLTISGRVVDAGGAPCGNVLVYPWELDLLTDTESAEDLAVPADAAPLQLSGNTIRAWARTDADGKFVLRGVGARDYRLRVHDDEVRWAWTSAPVAGGTSDVVLRLPAATTGPVAGRVTTRDGQPVVGITVLGIVTVHANGGGRVGEGVDVQVKTGDDGRFRFATMPRLGVELACTGEHWVDVSVPLDDAGDPEALAIVVLRRCHVRVECTGAAWADATIEFAGADDERLYITERRRNTVMSRQAVDLHDGKTGVLAVSEAATTLLLRTRDGKREQRVPVVLRPGEVTSIVNQIE